MSAPKTRDGLLELCIQDHNAAARLAAERLPQVAAAANGELGAVVTRAALEFAGRPDRFAELVSAVDGPENLWMAGIMDDAVRDIRTMKTGPLLDIAIAGAVRKALGADEVSLETAIALADELGQGRAGQALRAMRLRDRELLAELRSHLPA